MSNQTDTVEAPQSRPWRPESGLVFAVSDLLSPIFRVPSIELAREMAASAITAYDPETRAEWVSVGRTIAFSMAALAVLGNVAAADLPLSEQLRALGRACALNRAANECERTMMQRRRARRGEQPVHKLRTRPKPPAPETEPELDPVSELDLTAMQAAVAEAMQAYQTAAAPLAADLAANQSTPAPAVPATATPAATPRSKPRPNPPVSPPAAPTILRHANPPGGSSVSVSAPTLNAPSLNAPSLNFTASDATSLNAIGLAQMGDDPLQALTARFRQNLLRNSALSRVTDPSPPPHA